MDETKSLSDLETSGNNVTKMRQIKRQFVLICLAELLIFSGYSSTLLLQTSINIVDGVGASATAVSYSVSVIFGLFFAPFVVRLAGVKWTLLGSELCYLFYVLANCYPRKWLIMIAATSVGIAESLFWMVVGILFVYFGHLYQKHTTNRTKESCVREFSGILFCMFQINLIVGNTLVFAILYFWKKAENQKSVVFENITSSIPTFSSTSQTTIGVFKSENDRLFYCGANDCQNANLTQQNLKNYRPSNLVALYALMAAFVTVMVAGIILQACVTPNMPLDFISRQTKTNEDEKNIKTCKNNEDCDFEILVMWWKGVKDVFWRALSLKQVLLYIPTIYSGLIFGFLYSEATRTYASCVKGVSQVGICSIIYASANSSSAFIVGKLASKFSLQLVLVTSAVLDLLLYLLCLFWVPTEETSWLVYLIFIGFGISFGLWNIQAGNMYSESFKSNQELTFTFWCAIFAIGFATQYGWSTLICVREKLYIQIALLFVSTGCLQILRCKIKKRTKQENAASNM